jgi:hypothetical protein
MTSIPENAMPVDWACGPGTFSAGLTADAIKLCEQLHASLVETTARNDQLLAIAERQQGLFDELMTKRDELAQKLNSQQAQVQALLVSLVNQSKEHLRTYSFGSDEHIDATAHLAAFTHVYRCLFGTEVPA